MECPPFLFELIRKYLSDWRKWFVGRHHVDCQLERMNLTSLYSRLSPFDSAVVDIASVGESGSTQPALAARATDVIIKAHRITSPATIVRF